MRPRLLLALAACCALAIPASRACAGNLIPRIFVDRAGVDVFANDGELCMPLNTIVAADNRSLSLTARGRPANIETLRVHELSSAWPPAE